MRLVRPDIAAAQGDGHVGGQVDSTKLSCVGVNNEILRCQIKLIFPASIFHGVHSMQVKKTRCENPFFFPRRFLRSLISDFGARRHIGRFPLKFKGEQKNTVQPVLICSAHTNNAPRVRLSPYLWVFSPRCCRCLAGSPSRERLCKGTRRASKMKRLCG